MKWHAKTVPLPATAFRDTFESHLTSLFFLNANIIIYIIYNFLSFVSVVFHFLPTDICGNIAFGTSILTVRSQVYLNATLRYFQKVYLTCKCKI